MRPSSGRTLVRWAAHVFGDDLGTKVFASLVADWMRELDEAQGAWRVSRALASGAAAFLMTSARCVLTIAADREVLWALAVGSVFAVLGTALMAAPFALVQFVRMPARLWPLILPSLAAIAVPVALVPVGMQIGAIARPTDRAIGRVRVALVVIALAPTLLICTGWVVPAANQEWRLEIAASRGRRPPPPELREMTIPELRTTDAASRFGDRAGRELRRRVAIPLTWPPLLALLGWQIGLHRRHAGVGAMFFYWLVPAMTVVIVSFAPSAGFVFEAPDLVCAFIWLVAAAAFRAAGTRAGTATFASA